MIESIDDGYKDKVKQFRLPGDKVRVYFLLKGDKKEYVITVTYQQYLNLKDIPIMKYCIIVDSKET